MILSFRLIVIVYMIVGLLDGTARKIKSH